MWILRTDAGEVPSGLGWGFVGGWLLRRWKSAKTAEKIPELANAQTAGIFPATQPPRGLRSTTTPAESPAPPVLHGRPFATYHPVLHNFTIA